MSSKQKIKCCLAIVVAFLGLSQSQLSAQPAPTEINQVSPSEIEEKLNSSEFFLNNLDTGTASNVQELYEPPVFNQQGANRTIEWQMRVRQNDLKSPVEVEYEVKADNLTGNSFSQDNSRNIIPVTIAGSDFETLPDGNETETVIVKGRVTLKFDVSQFRPAGQYGGRVSVCVKDINDGCIGN